MSSSVERGALLTIAIAGLVLAGWAANPPAPMTPDAPTVEQIAALEGHLVEAPARDFALVDLDGNRRTLSEFRDHVVFLNFWATWCPPCIEEFPSMLALNAGLGDRPFVMIAVSRDEDVADVHAFLERVGIGDEVLILSDPDGAVTEAWGTQLLPETYAIAPDGQVFARFMGARDWSSEPAIRLFEHMVRDLR